METPSNYFAEDQANLASRKKAEARKLQTQKTRRAVKRKHDQAQDERKKRANSTTRTNQSRLKKNSSIENVDFEMETDQLEALLQDWDRKPENCNVSKSLIHSLIVYYLNSGHDRFGEMNQYASKLDGKVINKNSIIDEVQSQQLNGGDLYKMIEGYVTQHSSSANLYCCGSCGIREYETAELLYQRVILEDLPECFCYDSEQRQKYNDLMSQPPVEVSLENGELFTMEPWRVISCFHDVISDKLYHLHPELVELAENGLSTTMFCMRCSKSLQKCEASKLSIARGVDFGFATRIIGLEAPNLHEELILAKYRLYQCVIKVMPNGGWNQKQYTINSIRGNAILFLHDSVQAVTTAMKTREYIDELMQVVFYSHDGSVDDMARKAYGTSTIYARPIVLKKWLALLNCMHKSYEITDIEASIIVNAVEESVQQQQANRNIICDKDSIRFEQSLGSDVGSSQQVDPVAEGGQQQQGLVEDQEFAFRTSIVSPSPDQLLTQNAILSKVIVDATREVLLANSEVVGRSDITNTNNQQIDGQTENISLDSILQDLFGHQKANEAISVSREEHPISEFDGKDELLVGAFPHVFLLGNAYKRQVGSISFEQRNHLLKQFTMVPCRSRRLLGYLADALRRFEVIKGAKLRIAGSKKAVDKINEFVTQQEFSTLMVEAKKNPSGSVAKNVWREIGPFLQLAGGHVQYGVLQSSQALTRICEQARRFGCGCAFVTLSFADLFNTRSIRASIRSLDNSTFPAVFDGGECGECHDDFLEKLLKDSKDYGEGNILLDGPNTKYTRDYLARLAMENPIAYVEETKSLIRNVLSILFGLEPAHFFGATEGHSSRKTKYYKCRSKGILGDILAYTGTVEDHCKGTLHFHFIFYGSISPYVMQELGCVQSICDAVANALDTMYETKFTTRTNAKHLVHRIIRKSTNVSLKASDLMPISGPPLFQRNNILQTIQEGSGQEKETSLSKLSQLTAHERVLAVYHEHHRTCRKGYMGRCGCRLAKPSGLCNGTHCVLLEPQKPPDETEEMPKKKTTKEKYPYKIVDPVVLMDQAHYCLRNPLQRRDRDIIYWELDRPLANIGELDIPLDSNIDDHLTRTTVKMNLRKLLKFDATMMGDPYPEDSKMWTWIDNVDIKVLVAFYKELTERVKTANGYVVDHNIPLFFCTGSHNNVVLLGASAQAKSAIFYIAPYISKGKMTLSACLTVLEKCRKDIAKYPSKASDAKSNPRRRLAQYFVTKTLNKLNAYQELSDYQVAALLLRLPSQITSDTYDFCEPYGAMAFRKELQASENSEFQQDHIFAAQNDALDRLEREQEIMAEATFTMGGGSLESEQELEVEEASSNLEENDCNRNTSSSLLHSDRNTFGYVRLYLIEDCDEGEKPAKEAIPRVALYHNRGKSLRHLNRYEYDALIQVKEKPKNDSVARSLCFDFPPDFVLAARYTQQLKAKQPTMIFKGKLPPHPGQKPDRDSMVRNWQKQADKYANYILTMFRPEINNISPKNGMSNLDYSWNALELWIKSLQDDNCVISKFRLMTIDRRLQALNATFEQKVIVSDYRFRNHDKWTDLQHHQFDRQDHLAQMERLNDQSVLPDDEFSEANQMLSPAIEKLVRQILIDDSKFAASIARVPYGTAHNDGTTPTSSTTTDTSDSFLEQGMKNIVFGHDVDWVELSGYIYDEMNTGENIELELQQNNGVETGNTTEERSLNHGQTQIFDVYKKYLIDPSDPTNKPPPAVVLVTGKGGTGKSHLINALMEHGSTYGNKPMGSAFNNLNAADIGGITISKLLSEGIQPASDKNNRGRSGLSGITRPIKTRAVQALQRSYDVANIPLLIIDEVSNVTVENLSRLSKLFATARNRQEELFGGMPVMLVGDYNQKGPTGGGLATSHFLKYITEFNANTSDAVFDDSTTNYYSDRSEGCRILSQCRWFELTEAERSQDNEHNLLVDQLYNGIPIAVDDLKIYKLWDAEALKNDDKEEMLSWLSCPVICKTNRERYTLTHVRAAEFARATGTIVIRWRSVYRNWEGRPADGNNLEAALQDPAFFEYFVVGAPCYLGDTICRSKRLCNGTKGRYHLLILSSEIEEFVQIQVSHASLSFGDVITLPDHPLGINMSIDDGKVINNRAMSWRKLSLDPDKFVFTVRPGTKQMSNLRPVPIHSPSLLSRPSRVVIQAHFPLHPGFAITVDKAQGQTLDRVIVALSKREMRLVNFSYACFYVAMSRIRKRQHLRILLKKEDNEVIEWMTLLYIHGLRREKSIHSFFSGFERDRRNWIEDVWNAGRAIVETAM
jgi:hypothetical protein